jgi:hypothetical protein
VEFLLIGVPGKLGLSGFFWKILNQGIEEIWKFLDAWNIQNYHWIVAKFLTLL